MKSAATECLLPQVLSKSVDIHIVESLHIAFLVVASSD